MGGADPTGNMRLKLALQKAKENNIPKENINRAVQKGAGTLEGQSYEEIVYEGYGPAGVALTLSVLTDNRNRAAAEVRHIFSKYGGNMGETGCVAWMFKNRGVFIVAREAADEDRLMEIALEAGADNIRTDGDEYEIITVPEAYDDVEKALADNRIPVEHAQIMMVPDSFVALGKDDAQKLENMIDAFDDLDDVQDVYHNGDIPDDMDEA